jgi:hypothetical protein
MEEFHMRKMYCNDHVQGVWTQHEPNDDQEICWSCWNEEKGRNESFAGVDLREVFRDWLADRGSSNDEETWAAAEPVVHDLTSSPTGSPARSPRQRSPSPARSPRQRSPHIDDVGEGNISTDIDASSVSDVNYSDSARDSNYETGSDFEPSHRFRKGQRVRHNNRTLRVRKDRTNKISLGSRYDDYDVPISGKQSIKKARKKVAGPNTRYTGWKTGDKVYVKAQGKIFRGTITGRDSDSFDVEYKDKEGETFNVNVQGSAISRRYEGGKKHTKSKKVKKPKTWNFWPFTK